MGAGGGTLQGVLRDSNKEVFTPGDLKEVLGDDFDQVKFDELKGEDGCVTMAALLSLDKEREELSHQDIAEMFHRSLHLGHTTHLEKNAAGDYYEVDDETGEVVNGNGPLPDKPPTPEVPYVAPKPGEVEQKAVDEAAEEVKGATAALEAAVAALEAMPEAMDEASMDAAEAAKKVKTKAEAALKVATDKKAAADAALAAALEGGKMLEEVIAEFDASLTKGLANAKGDGEGGAGAGETPAADPAPAPAPAPAAAEEEPAPAPAPAEEEAAPAAPAEEEDAPVPAKEGEDEVRDAEKSE